MNKKEFLLIVLIVLIGAIFLCADYLIMKDGKKIKIDGSYKIDGQSVVFKIKGSDLEVSLPLEKVDLEKTKAYNTSIKEGDKSEKKVKVFTNKDIKGQDRVVSTEDNSEDTASSSQAELPEVQAIPNYNSAELEGQDNDWWSNEVTRVQNMLQEAYKVNRNAINQYNEMVIAFNAKKDNERAAMKPEVEAKAEAIKQSKELIKSWYNSIQSLYDIGVELGKEQWLLKPLAETLESNKNMIE